MPPCYRVHRADLVLGEVLVPETAATPVSDVVGRMARDPSRQEQTKFAAGTAAKAENRTAGDPKRPDGGRQ